MGLLTASSKPPNFVYYEGIFNDGIITPGQEVVYSNGQVIDLSSPSTFSAPKLAGPDLQYISRNLLAFTLKDLSERLTILGPEEYKKPLREGFNWNLLHEAVYTDNVEVASLLIDRFGFDPNAWDAQFGNCVYLVNSVRMVKMLQARGTNFSINDPCYMYFCPTNSAIIRNNFSIFASRNDFHGRLQWLLEAMEAEQKDNGRLEFAADNGKMYPHFLNKMGKVIDDRNTNAKIKVKFRGENGVDQGGLTKFFITLVKDEMLKAGRVFENDTETGFLNIKIGAPLNEVKCAGFLVGLSIFHRTPIKVLFSPIIYHLILAEKVETDINFVSVMRESSEEVMKSFENIKKYSDNVLDSIEFPEIAGDHLKPWKRRRTVIGSRENISEYIKISSKELVYGNRAKEYAAFLFGLSKAINYSNLRNYLTTEELKSVIAGQLEDYTGADLRNNAGLLEEIEVFPNQYDWLFEIVDELTTQQRVLLLKYFTSLECLPVGGFKGLKAEDKVKIEMKLVPGDPDAHYPEAGTCMNSLRIFPYNSKAAMKEKLIETIEKYGEGFHER